MGKRDSAIFSNSKSIPMAEFQQMDSEEGVVALFEMIGEAMGQTAREIQARDLIPDGNTARLIITFEAQGRKR